MIRIEFLKEKGGREQCEMPKILGLKIWFKQVVISMWDVAMSILIGGDGACVVPA